MCVNTVTKFVFQQKQPIELPYYSLSLENYPMGSGISMSQPPSQNHIANELDQHRPKDIDENIVILQQTPTNADIQFIYNVCRKMPFFNDMPAKKIQRIARKFSICANADEEWLFKEGSRASYFFILAAGHVQVVKNGVLIKNLVRGDSFGEMALMYKIKRSSSIKILRECKKQNRYFVLNRKDFIESVQQTNPTKNTQFFHLTEGNPVFSYLTFRDRLQLSTSATKLYFKQHQKILTSYDEPYAYFILASGEVQLNFANSHSIRVEPGRAFGFVGSDQIDCTAQIMVNSTVYAIGRDEMRSILGPRLKYFYLWHKLQYAIIKSSVFCHLTYEEVEQLSRLCTFTFVRPHTVVCRNADAVDKLYVPLSCVQKEELVVLGEQRIREQGAVYGRDFVSDRAGHYAQVDWDVLNRFMQGLQSKEETAETKQQQSQPMFDFASSAPMQILPQSNPHLRQTLQQELTFGMRYLLTTVPSSRSDEVNSLIEKADLLQQISCNFIQSFYFLHQAPSHSVLALEHIKGRTIRQLTQKIGILPLNLSRFYIACAVVAVQYLNSKGIRCGSLVMDSFKVDEEGYLWLAHMEGAMLEMQSEAKSQLLTNRNISNEFAFNAKQLGYIVYEMLVGYSLDRMGLATNTLGNNRDELCKFPMNFSNRDARELIKALIFASDQEEVGSWEEVRKLAFFRGLEWEKLQRKTLQPPVIPRSL